MKRFIVLALMLALAIPFGITGCEPKSEVEEEMEDVGDALQDQAESAQEKAEDVEEEMEEAAGAIKDEAQKATP